MAPPRIASRDSVVSVSAWRGTFEASDHLAPLTSTGSSLQVVGHRVTPAHQAGDLAYPVGARHSVAQAMPVVLG
jgi:hypothetical protein